MKKQFTVWTIFALVLLSSVNSHAFCIFACDEDITPESVIEKFMAAKSPLENGNDDLKAYFTTEFLERNSNRFYEMAYALKMPYGTFKRIDQNFKVTSALTTTNDGLLVYLVSAPNSVYPYQFEVICKSNSNSKIENCLIAKISKRS